MSQIQWTNYVVFSKFAKNSEGHIPADDLIKRIQTHPGGEAYYNAFDLEPRATFKGYQGVARPAMGLVSFDFDSETDPKLSLEQVQRFLIHLGSPPDAAVFFSGKKGFHVGVPQEYFGLSPAQDLPARLADYATSLSKQFPTLDTTVYNSNRKFRLPRSIHPDTRLYKIQLPTVEFLQGSLSLDAIRKRAEKPGLFQLEKAHRQPSTALVEALRDSGRASYEVVVREKEVYSQFEKFGDKKCIQAMLDKRAEPGSKQSIAMRIISDLFNRGVHLKETHEILAEWCIKNQVIDGKVSETIDQIYGGEAYSYGCNDRYKREHCSGKCALYSKLSPETRPPALDAPAKLQAQALKKKKPSEHEIAQALLSKFQDKLLKQDRALFRYKDGHWKEVKLGEIDQIKVRIMEACENEATSYEVDSIYRTFVRELDPVPPGINLFDASPVGANFKNGTLHLRKTINPEGEAFRLEFLPHRQEDYMTNLLPYDYDESKSQKNQPFLEMLDRVFEGSPDKDEKIRAVKQMYGACLVPLWPHFFMLHGKPQTGKSTLIQIAEQLVSEENICSVEPHQFNGFNMESMIGKLVNADPDISTEFEISESQIKKVEDRRRFRIRRKGIADIYGFIPAIHMWGGNNIPPTATGYHKAHDRRWTFLEFKNVQGVGFYSKTYWKWIWDQNPQGIVNFALEGLEDLAARKGHFINPESGKLKLVQWQEEGDSVAQFLQSVADGEGDLVLDSNSKLMRSKLYECYQLWAEGEGYRWVPQTRAQFFSVLRAKGWADKKIEGVWYFMGVCVKVNAHAQH